MNLWHFRDISDEHVQKIANAFFLSVAVLGVAFAYFILSARAEDLFSRSCASPLTMAATVKIVRVD